MVYFVGILVGIFANIWLRVIGEFEGHPFRQPDAERQVPVLSPRFLVSGFQRPCSA